YYVRGQAEGQADFGLVDRLGNRVQAGLFASFKHVNLAGNQTGGTLGEGALAVDYIFSRGRVGIFGTKGFLDNALINSVHDVDANGVFQNNILVQSYLKIVDQAGVAATVGLWGNNYAEGNLGYLKSVVYGDHIGGTVRLIFPLNSMIALTAEGGVNETLLSSGNDGRAAFGVQLGNMIRPKEYLGAEYALPMEVPRIRYEVLTRRVRTGNDPPVADAGPNQFGVAAGTVQLDGSASYDPDGDPITFQWTQQATQPGAAQVTLVNPNTARPTFTAAAGQTYNFLLTVKDDHGGQGQARVRVSTNAAARAEILFFTASPSQITSGQVVTLSWKTNNADTANIDGIGNVGVNNSLTVSPTQTTTYTLTARNNVNDVTSTATVTVGPATGGNPPPAAPVIASFTANPTNISAGQSSTLQWSVQNSTSVSISSIGTVSATGTHSVSPAVTTTYTLTATNATGSTTSTATVTVGSGSPIIVFNPSNFIYTTTRDLALDASGSSSPAGNNPLQFYWTSRGDKAVIYQRTSATPRIYLPGSTGNYVFDLTITDSKGNSTTQTLTVRLIGQ
ncbi:MAG: PKD domain-containing protein, partial [Bryobacteraceae bacterium]